MSVTADLPDLNLGLALACLSIRTEGGEVGHISRHSKPLQRSKLADPLADPLADAHYDAHIAAWL